MLGRPEVAGLRPMSVIIPYLHEAWEHARPARQRARAPPPPETRRSLLGVIIPCIHFRAWSYVVIPYLQAWDHARPARQRGLQPGEKALNRAGAAPRPTRIRASPPEPRRSLLGVTMHSFPGAVIPYLHEAWDHARPARQRGLPENPTHLGPAPGETDAN